MITMKSNIQITTLFEKFSENIQIISSMNSINTFILKIPKNYDLSQFIFLLEQTKLTKSILPLELPNDFNSELC